MVGDRLDTDIEAAVLAGMRSLMVLTGVSTAADLLAAPESRRPTYVSFDLRGLVDEHKVFEIVADDPSGPARPWSVEVADQELVLRKADDGAVEDLEYDALGALAALSATAWSTGVTTVHGADEPAVAALATLGLPTGAS